jgi:hypothetical protein
MIFGTPSAKTVFKDMQETMLKTKSVTLKQDYKMSGDGVAFNLKSTTSMDMTSNKTLLAQGDYALNINSGGVPIDVKADFIIIGSDKYVRFTSISSTNPNLASSMQTLESKLKGNWVKAREKDDMYAYTNIQTELLSTVLPTPYANLGDAQRKVVLDILRDDSTYTIDESSKVEINGVSAYKYSLSYSKDQYNKFEKAIAGYVDYFKASDSNESELKTLNVWVDINTKQIIKIEFTGTSKNGSIEGSVLFSDYNKSGGIVKPADYSIESELLN